MIPESKGKIGDFRALCFRINGHTARRGIDGGETFIWDDELPGFDLRQYASGRQRWIVQLRPAWRHAAHHAWRRVDGCYPDAREQARALLAQHALDGF